MLKSLFRKTAGERPLDTARIPDGQRVYAIGDVHGRVDLLNDLLDRIVADDRKRAVNSKSCTDTLLIFLGDLIDRGPDSKAVIELALDLKEKVKGVRFLMGNHEEMLLSATKGSEEATRFFLRIGGRETILSYGLPHSQLVSLEMSELAQEMTTLIPQDHLDFISSFEDRIIIGDYAFVHAGIKPGIPLDEQKSKHLRWIREEFIEHDEPFEKVVVYGHTISDGVVESHSHIGIDTGAYESGVLTAIGLEGKDRWYLDTAPDQLEKGQ